MVRDLVDQSPAPALGLGSVGWLQIIPNSLYNAIFEG